MPAEPGELGDFEDGQIPVVDSRAANRVSSSVTESTESRFSESAGVEPFIQRPLGSVEDGVADDIRPLTNSGIAQACLIVLKADVERTPGTESADAVNLPSGSENSHDAGGFARKREFPHVVENQGVGNVLVRDGFLPFGMERILHREEAAFAVFVGRRGDVPRIRVRSLE